MQLTLLALVLAEHAGKGELTYVHCKAGRGRSTSLVLCYLVKHHRMAPAAALEQIRSKRQQVRLSPVRWHHIVAAPGLG